MALRSLDSLNAEVHEVATANRWRTHRLGDGELVVWIAGAGRPEDGHAGMWGSDTWYILIEHSRPNIPLQHQSLKTPGLVVETNDAGFLVKGPRDPILAVLHQGPRPLRARRRGPGGPGASPERMAALREKLPVR